MCILKEEAGRQFDPNLVPIFVNLVLENKIKVALNQMPSGDKDFPYSNPEQTFARLCIKGPVDLFKKDVV